MENIIKAEHLKIRRTFSIALPIVAPILTLALVFALTGGMDHAFPAGAWNWWYSMLLPGMLSVLCYLNIAKERKCKYYNLKALSVSVKKLLLGKIAYLSIELALSNAIIFLGAYIGGFFFGTTISVSRGIVGAVLLTVSFLWEIPLYLFLSTRFGMFASVFSCMVLSIGGVATVADSTSWWLFPASIPVRLMCPVLRLLPNGLPVPIESELLNTSVILPGIMLSLVWFIGMTFFFIFWFDKKEVR